MIYKRLRDLLELSLLIVFISQISPAEGWDDLPPIDTHSLQLEERVINSSQMELIKTAHVPASELYDLGLYSIGSGTETRGYFFIEGKWNINYDGGYHIDNYEIDPALWLITEDDVLWPDYTKASQSTFFGCGCTESSGYEERERFLAGFGFGIYYEAGFPYLWPSYWYYRFYTHLCFTCFKFPCQNGGGGYDPKNKIVFTDSLYNEFPDTLNVVLSGDSRLYFKAKSFHSSDSLAAWLYLQTGGDSVAVVKLDEGPDEYWRGSYKDARSLGLKSYNTVIAELHGGSYGDVAANDELDVCLPRVILSKDTVLISHGNMKVSEDLVASLEIMQDSSTALIGSKSLIDTAGYQYRSFWVANSNLADTSFHHTYRRFFPRDTTTLLWWNGSRDSCAITFNRDSLCAVGGSLSVDCSGELMKIDNIDNRFKVSTDSTINDTLIKPTKLVFINSDPPNNILLDSLQYDIIKAIAWVEYAGSNDIAHCHNPYHPRYNNYWDDVINGADTCHDTHYPCENRITTATGTMQMLRRTWERLFSGAMPYEPHGYTTCGWDSLAWNWKINISGGKYIYFVNNFFHMTKDQKTWDSLCVNCNEADSLPPKPNKEDLSVYGYKWGSRLMREVTKDNWKDTMSDPRFGKYVRDVRGSKYAKPWQ